MTERLLTHQLHTMFKGRGGEANMKPKRCRWDINVGERWPRRKIIGRRRNAGVENEKRKCMERKQNKNKTKKESNSSGARKMYSGWKPRGRGRPLPQHKYTVWEGTNVHDVRAGPPRLHWAVHTRTINLWIKSRYFASCNLRIIYGISYSVFH